MPGSPHCYGYNKQFNCESSGGESERPGARVSGAVPAPLDDATIIRALQASKAEAAAGRMAESDQLLARLAQHAPNHPAVLNELGVRMLDRSAAEQAHALFVRATNADPNHPSLWANLASSLKALGRRTRGRLTA